MEEQAQQTSDQKTQTGQKISWKKIAVTVVVIVLVTAIIAALIWFFVLNKPESTSTEPVKVPTPSSKQATPSATATPSAEKDETADWEIYKSAKGGYSIKYPNSWFIGLEITTNTPDTPGSNIYILNLTSCDNKESQCQFKGKENFLQISVQDKYNESLDTYFQALTAEHKVLDKKTTTLDSETAIRYSRKQSGDPNLLYHHELVKHLDKVYNIEFTLNTGSTSAEQNQSEKTFDQILSTFKFLD